MSQAETGPSDDPAETASYIRSMAQELGQMAAGSGFGFLAYLLRMVEEQAGALADDSVTEKSD